MASKPAGAIKKASREVPRHLVMRIARYAETVVGKTDVIEAHNEVARREGRVSLAKFGRSVSQARLAGIRNQIENGVPAYVILVFRVAVWFTGFSARLRTIVDDGTSPPKTSIPTYYDDLEVGDASCWFELDGPLTQTELDGLRLTTNDRPLLEVLKECRTSLLFVQGQMGRGRE